MVFLINLFSIEGKGFVLDIVFQNFWRSMLWKMLNLSGWLQAFDVIKKQEETRQAELAAKMQEFKALQAQAETVRLIFCGALVLVYQLIKKIVPFICFC